MMKKYYSANMIWQIALCWLLLVLLSSGTFAAQASREGAMPEHKVESAKDLKIISDFEALDKEILAQINSSTITDSELGFYRTQVISMRREINALTEKYRSKLAQVRRLTKDFALTAEDEKADKTVNTKIDLYYTNKMSELRGQVSFYKGTLLQLRLLDEDARAYLKKIVQMRLSLHDGSMWIGNEPFYSSSAWSDAYHEFIEYNAILVKELSEKKGVVLTVLSTVKFWVYVAILLAVIYLYFSILRSKTSKLIYKNMGKVNDKFSYRSTLLLLYVLIRGVIPVGIIMAIAQLLLKGFQLSDSPLITNMIGSAFNALAFIVIMFSLVFIVLNKCLDVVHYKTANAAQRYTMLIIVQVGIIFFINNINFFSLISMPAPFYPNQPTALLNLVMGVLLFISVIRVFQLIQVAKQEARNV